MKRIAVLASGSGTNAQNLYEYFNDHDNICIDCILSNNPSAFVLERAKKMTVESLIFDKKQFYETDFVIDFLQKRQIDWVVLAGFLWLIPTKLINNYQNRIINIHPALLPKYGGKGMYGDNVHKAVINEKEQESGITIHYVNEEYDDGKIIFQAKCPINKNDTSNDLAKKIHELEQSFFPSIVENTILDKIPDICL